MLKESIQRGNGDGTLFLVLRSDNRRHGYRGNYLRVFPMPRCRGGIAMKIKKGRHENSHSRGQANDQKGLDRNDGLVVGNPIDFPDHIPVLFQARSNNLSLRS